MPELPLWKLNIRITINCPITHALICVTLRIWNNDEIASQIYANINLSGIQIRLITDRNVPFKNNYNKFS